MKGKIHWIGSTEAQTFQEKEISESEDKSIETITTDDTKTKKNEKCEQGISDLQNNIE